MVIVPNAVDLFAGAGGATQGLRDAGFDVLGAVEYDKEAAATYRLNHPNTSLFECDIRNITATRLMRELGLARGQLGLLKACPPCQGFSTLASGMGLADEERNDLVNTVTRFVRVLRPQAILLENVPGLGRNYRFRALLDRIELLGYTTKTYEVNATEFGVPQRRRRLIVIALRGRRRSLPNSVLEGNVAEPTTVRSAFGQLAQVLDPSDPMNVHRRSTASVLARIKAIPIGGNRFDLPPELQLACHRRIGNNTRNATASYGRMKLDEAAPTMTTRCTTPACGSFIHPTEHRGITLREAAVLQTFPPNYQFVGGYDSIERQIGNAVPVKMATALGKFVLKRISENGGNADSGRIFVQSGICGV